ncbi:STAS domain-containing protein [Rariglobus hedericola]|uniref:STAS domain-containing protein n=1 Tax=Rariglobus hedericola TaxID=2597822 RepID=A0A556QMF8_9BACT|nr:STAS domain-containing protein [Rariglobus hedericola]TSJ77838.1 STAS domain-containing protein [Rariglobus hedericola]
MADATKPTFLVDAGSDPVAIRIEGRASFQNSACLNDFFSELIAAGKTRFMMDFLNCTSMDSTFLGVLAGVALKLRKQTPPGSLVLCRMAPRNLELVRNLGLHRLLTVDADTADLNLNTTSALPCSPDKGELESARLVLAAHENLVAADEDNRAKFQDVLAFLKNRVSQG